jgi:hypothetical protein
MEASCQLCAPDGHRGHIARYSPDRRLVGPQAVMDAVGLWGSLLIIQRTSLALLSYMQLFKLCKKLFLY